ncbi:MAG TPA: hypothetical protein G4O15_01730 [Dehalococcoidia bacterium]|nr:hypothetical protein [Dehalococcoidia bacterium]
MIPGITPNGLVPLGMNGFIALSIKSDVNPGRDEEKYRQARTYIYCIVIWSTGARK